MAEVKRKKGESFESLLRRFTKKVQQSGKILQAKKIRYHERPKNKNSKRAGALRREYLREQREYLLKTGQATEEDFGKRSQSRRR